MNNTEPKHPHGSADWLRQRWATPNGERRLAASECAAIYEVHPYKSRADLAAELMSDSAPQPTEQNEAMERGNRLEPTLIAWASDRYGAPITTPDVIHTFDEEIVHLAATLDGLGEDGSVHEIKTTTHEWSGWLPPHWFYQGVQQAICADVDEINWWVFDRSQTFKHYVQVIDWEMKRNHIEAAKEFLAAIHKGEAPEGVVFAYDHIQTIYSMPQDETIEIGSQVGELIDLLDKAKVHKDHWGQEEDRLKALIAELLGNATIGTVEGNQVVTWKQQTRTSLDTKALTLAHPEIVKQYEKSSTFRVLRINRKGK
jgi:predicted phage-related endonuclease